MKTSKVIKVVNKSNNKLPEFETKHAAAADVRAFVPEPIVLKPMQRVAVPTGLFVEIPIGYKIELHSRSGLSLKKGVILINAPGILDADFRGEVKIILINLSDTDFIINSGERICQMTFEKKEPYVWEIVESLSETDRGTGGFGHTGIA